jgi:hypothetical protein
MALRSTGKIGQNVAGRQDLSKVSFGGTPFFIYSPAASLAYPDLGAIVTCPARPTRWCWQVGGPLAPAESAW